jgi:hypothetical protein
MSEQPPRTLMPEEVRQRLIEYMTGPSKRSLNAVSKDIARKWPQMHADKPPLGDMRRTLQRFLDPEGFISANSYNVIYEYLAYEKVIDDATVVFTKSRDLLFRQLCDFYGANPGRKAEDNAGPDVLPQHYAGTFAFHAWSEDYKSHASPYVVRGAITFSYSPDDGTSSITEQQRGDLSGETWNGYFLTFGKTCVVIARKSQFLTPKIYVLAPSGFFEGTRQVKVLVGHMSKVGDEGGVFSSGILMEREDDAAERCAVVPASRVRKSIRDRLGPPP